MLSPVLYAFVSTKGSAQLSDAINSMFRWYQNAIKCYNYLSNVSTDDVIRSGPSQLLGDSVLSQSRWFTQGWTLQELLALRLV
jgi:hypothetical protein